MRTVYILLLLSLLCGKTAAQPTDYVWTTPSKNSAESMPCGGGDVGMNVWVEQGDVLFYLSRSGSFDENNTLLKQGRFRISLSPGLDMQRFRQTLHMAEGYVEISDGSTSIQLWADVAKPVVHVDVEGSRKLVVAATYENWRTRDIVIGSRERFQTSYKFAAPKGLKTLHDSIVAGERSLLFWHRNAEETIFDATVSQQKMDSVKLRLYNPLSQLTFGGRMQGEGFVMMDTVSGRYASTPYEGWIYVTEQPRRKSHLQIALSTLQGSTAQWMAALEKTERTIRHDYDRRNTRRWWQQFWQRSYIETTGGKDAGVPIKGDSAAMMVRNYALFRYMLGCNANGQWPTKFNGGLFTFDPEYVNNAPEYRLSPDFRNWGGGVHTAQNQRLVYWPMLKSGDYDLLKPQLDFYLRIYRNAEERSRLYWGHGGACLTEQIENYGLPCYPEYGTKRPAGFDPGMERNAWLEYEWDTCLEFCQMALDAHRYGGIDISQYIPMIESCLLFFDEHYQYLASQRGAKRLDGQGKLVLYPGSGGETFKGAYNSTSTIAALRTVAQSLLEVIGEKRELVSDSARRSSLTTYHSSLLRRLPDITIRDGMLQPALHYERIQNVETTQLYPVFPWRIYGVGRPDIEVARRTYEADSLALKFRSHVGWKQDAIWAACLGLTDEAMRLTGMKLGDGPHRFPAFWGPGYDWTPDHNWGGSGMIALQEMLMQEDADGKIHLFPAWPREHDIRFRLHASRGTTVEAELRGGKVVNIKVYPEERLRDIIAN
ncbi:MAG: hypothetical protein IJ637_04375 [Prevotella sp.]|nr:hypothetical protein [Prevotella sp.]